VNFEREAYDQFLRAKATVASNDGFEVELAEVNPVLHPHQAQLVQWAVRGGRRAIFAAFGVGKSVIQLEALRLTLARAGGCGLIVCPLGVQQEFAHDARLLGMPEPVRVRTTEQAQDLADGTLAITNYEPVRDGKLDPGLFTAVSLDEAAILRSFGSKTYQTFLTLFQRVPYRFVATATPSPNRYKELIHYSAYLGILDSGQALTRFFKRDSTQANNLTLLESQEANFWLWLASWSVWLQSPAELCDCGCHTAGASCDRCVCAEYLLPELHLEHHEIEVDHRERLNVERNSGQTYLLADGAMSLQAASAEKRASIPARVRRTLELVNGYLHADAQDQVIVYCHLNDEQRAIENALREQGISYSSIDGSMTTAEVERRLAEWKAKRTSVLLGKPVMLGVGLNLQQASRMIFAGIDYRFHDTIQAVHRIHRFGQKRTPEVHLIHAESEREIVKTLMGKWRQHEELTHTMSTLIQEHGLSRASVEDALKRSLGVERVEASGDGWRLVNNDCVPEVASMADSSVGLIVTSIPFSNHYEYTPAYEDLGFTESNEHFWRQMDFLTPELLRVLQPGRVYCCHVKDRILFGNVTGAGVPTSSPFHAEAIMHGLRHGFDYLGMVTVVTDVVRENNQTYRLGWSEQCKDATKMGAGSPEYVLLFHKPQTDRTKGYADVPVMKDKESYSRSRWQVDAHAFWRSNGNRALTPDDLARLGPDRLAKLYTEFSLQEVYDHEAHVHIGEELDGRGALPSTFMALAPGSHDPMVWHDVNRMRTLNGEQSMRGLAQHICPLQIDIVERLIRRYSNEQETVLDPFSGLGTVPLCAVRLGREGAGVELNGGYFLDAIKYLQAEERKRSMPTLFDALEAA
jgi:DNA modification methylase